MKTDTGPGSQEGSGRYIHLLVVLFAACFILSSPVRGDLLESEVLLLYNSGHPDSLAIRNAYRTIHPGVREFDLALTYAAPADPGAPAPGDITQFFITPEAFEAQVRQPLLAYLQNEAPEIIGFVTTRGLPVLISNNFAPPLGHGNENGVVSGFEGSLARLGLEGPTNLVGTGFRDNPYRDSLNVPFRDFLAAECLKGQLFLVSRLDATATNTQSPLEVVIDLLQRSRNLSVVKDQAHIIIDDTPGGCSDLSPTRTGAQRMRDLGWCVFYDETDQFLHGSLGNLADDVGCSCPNTCQQRTVEQQYFDQPELIHAGLGVNHSNLCLLPDSNRECVSKNYVQHYDAHPAGLFISMESFNGVSLWNAGSNQGNALDWIGYGGGSFTVAHVYGVFSAFAPQTDLMIANLYEHGMSWGESVFSSLPWLGFHATPIGDPLATITLTTSGNPTPITPCPSLDFTPIPPPDFFLPPTDSCLLYSGVLDTFRCQGDFNGDAVVDIQDLDLVIQNQSCNCLVFDVTQDGVVDHADVAFVAANFKDLGDVNNDGAVTCADLFLLVENRCTSNCNPAYDLNCDGQVNFSDWEHLVNTIVDLSGVGVVIELDYDSNGFLNCLDLQLLHDNISSPANDPVFDLNGDGLVDCNDEWLYEWMILNFGGSPCVGLGCEGCTSSCQPSNPGPCPADIMPNPPGGPIGNGLVNVDDLVAVMNAVNSPCDPVNGCSADITGNCVVDIDDITTALINFGPCP